MLFVESGQLDSREIGIETVSDVSELIVVDRHLRIAVEIARRELCVFGVEILRPSSVENVLIDVGYAEIFGHYLVEVDDPDRACVGKSDVARDEIAFVADRVRFEKTLVPPRFIEVDVWDIVEIFHQMLDGQSRDVGLVSDDNVIRVVSGKNAVADKAEVFVPVSP